LSNDKTCDSIIAGKGILTSAIATGVLGFLTTILFLFCIPDLDTFFALDAPQPFVQLYALALGKGPSVFMTIIAVIGLIMVRTRVSRISLVLIFAPSRTVEYQYSRGGLFAAPLRRSARWRAPALTLDRTRRQQSTAEERSHGHVRLCGRPAILYHT
jgi:amino acid transporter